MTSPADGPIGPSGAARTSEQPPGGGPAPIGAERLRAALSVIDLSFEDDELTLMGTKVARHREALRRIRAADLDPDVAPALRFEPRVPGLAPHRPRTRAASIEPRDVRRPPDAELPWSSIRELSALVRSRQVTCVELATLAIARLREVDRVLRCVVTVTEDRALEQARALDAELDAGRWRGLLHGVPWGAKDLLAVRGYPTTWGTPPFAQQMIDRDATVVERLDAAGAVLVAKLSLGELASGDLWAGGRTANPWEPSQGSSGSSAGSAAAVSAGCLPFALGSETLGSILSPSYVCGVTGLRPTFGRVSRHGAMALSWSMDKLGPIARSAEDAAIVLAAIAGPDGIDEAVTGERFEVPEAIDPRGWRIGVVETAFDRVPGARGALDELRSLGCELVPVALPHVELDDAWVILETEAAAAFDELLRSGEVRRMVAQDDEAWPNTFRAARLVPAVDYLRANRLRRLLIHGMDDVLDGLDLLVHPTDEDDTLALENLTGHPAIALPWGRRENDAPDSVALAGHLDGEADLLAFAIAWQERSAHHRRRPPI